MIPRAATFLYSTMPWEKMSVERNQLVINAFLYSGCANWSTLKDVRC